MFLKSSNFVFVNEISETNEQLKLIKISLVWHYCWEAMIARKPRILNIINNILKKGGNTVIRYH